MSGFDARRGVGGVSGSSGVGGEGGETRIIALLAMAVLFVGGPLGSANAAKILLNDGLSHTVSDEIHGGDQLYVRNMGCGTLEQLNEACAAPGGATDLLLASGASVFAVQVDDSSSITLDGGTLTQSFVARGASSATLLSGSVGSSFVGSDTSILAIGGGRVGSSVSFWGEVLASMSGGSVGADFAAGGASTAVISGGVVDGEVRGSGMSAVTVTGGTQTDGWRADGSSTITIVGSGFTVNGGAVPYGPLSATSGTLAGTLDSGESIAGAPFSQRQPVWDTGRIVLAPSALPPTASEDVLVSWGGGYSIDDWTFAHDALFVRDVGCGTAADPQASCGAPGAATSLELAAGSATGSLAVHDSSTLVVAGGLVGTMADAWGSASIDMSDGLVIGNLSAHESAALVLTGGTVRADLIADGTASADVGGGIVLRFTKVEGRAGLDVSGGQLQRGLLATGSATAVVAGGLLVQRLNASEMSAVTLTGGVLDPRRLTLTITGSATLTIVGSGFAVDGFAVGYGPLAATSGQLTGTLDSGDAIDNPFTQGVSGLGRIVLAAAADPPPAAGDVLLNDGGAHLASDWGQSRSTLYVRNAGCGSAQDPTALCAAPGAASTLEIPSGGAAGAVAVYDSASVTLDGGITGVDIDAWGSASVTILGGSVGGRTNAHDSSTITIVDGTLRGGVNALDDASVAIEGGLVNQGLVTNGSSSSAVTGGTVTGVDAYGASTVEISGGTLPSGAYANDTASVLFTGGTVGDVIEIYDAASLTLTGGLFDDDVIAYEASSITVEGGRLDYDLGGYDTSAITLRGVTQGSLFSLFVYDTAVLTIHGSGFAIDGAPVGPGPLSAEGGMLSGTLESGDALDAPFFRAASATIMLVPEPAPALLHAMVLACLGGLARRELARKRRLGRVAR